MKKQQGSALVIVLSILGVIVAGVIAVVMMAISAYNTGNTLETNIKATYENNKNILGQYGQKVLEAAQVPDMARDDLMKVARAAMEGRYGADGSKAVFQAITEQNPTVDPQLYRQIQQIIEGGRNEFQNAQTRLIDQKATYERALGSFPQGVLMRMVGYPRINLADFKVITTDRTEQTFKNGKEDAPIRLRPTQP